MKQIDQLRAALARTEARISAYITERYPDTCPCCVDAADGGIGSPLAKMKAKRDRQEGWLGVLWAKEGNGDLARETRNYVETLARQGLGPAPSDGQ